VVEPTPQQQHALLEARYRAIFQASRDALLVADAESGMLLDANPAALKLLGRTLDEIPRLHQRDVHAREDAAAGIAAFQRYRTDTGATEHVVLRSDGKRVPVEITGIPLEDVNGRKLVLGVFHDLTERRHAEELLRLNEEKFRQIAEHVHEIFWILDVIGPKFLYVNPQYERITGRTCESLYQNPMSLLKVIAPEDRLTSYPLFEQQLRGELAEAEYRIQTLEGEIKWLRISAFPVTDESGRVVRVAGVAQDVSEQKRTELDLRKSKEAAEAASRAKSEFLANMSHEIRTPMNGVLGMTELALETELSDEQRELLETAKSSAGVLLTVINDILDFSKIEAEKLELDPIPFRLRDCVARIMKPLAFRAEEKGLELLWTVERSVPDHFVADPTRLAQIITNLVGNAIKFTDAGEVELGVQLEEQTGSHAKLHFQVRDTGIGIPPDQQMSIFEAFSQLNSTHGRRAGGTGLGLTISARLLQLMGGRIWVESKINQGSCFHFTIEAPLSSEADRMDAVPAVSLAGLPVLIVDDNATNRRILREVVEAEGMRASVASSGEEGLRLLAAGECEVLLVDCHMSGMDGFEMVAQIRASRMMSGKPIIMLTSAGQRGDAARCRELDVMAFLTKPISQDRLIETIRLTLGRSTVPASKPRFRAGHMLADGITRLHILVAEDNAVNQKVCRRILEKQNHAVTVVSTGREVLGALREQKFDLILMDIQMPEMDGFETAAAIRGTETPGEHIPIIALTAYAMSGDKERCLAAGMDGYASKPISAAELKAEIQRILEKRISGPVPEHSPAAL